MADRTGFRIVGQLDDLDDVIITTPINGQVIKHDGTNWTNGTDNAGAGISGTTGHIVTIGAGNTLADGGHALSEYALTTHTHAATAITTGTLADARLSSNVPLKNANNIFSANQVMSLGLNVTGDITLSNTSVVNVIQAQPTSTPGSSSKGITISGGNGQDGDGTAPSGNGGTILIQPGQAGTDGGAGTGAAGELSILAADGTGIILSNAGSGKTLLGNQCRLGASEYEGSTGTLQVIGGDTSSGIALMVTDVDSGSQPFKVDFGGVTSIDGTLAVNGILDITNGNLTMHDTDISGVGTVYCSFVDLSDGPLQHCGDADIHSVNAVNVVANNVFYASGDDGNISFFGQTPTGQVSVSRDFSESAYFALFDALVALGLIAQE